MIFDGKNVKVIAGNNLIQYCGTIIDSEYIEQNDTYYFFDIPVSEMDLTDNINLLDRIKLLNNFKEILDKYIKIKITEFIIPSEEKPLDLLAKEMLSKIGELEFKIDGLIYTSIMGNYSSSIYRWKPIHTIDFFVLLKETKKGLNIYELYSYVGKNEISNYSLSSGKQIDNLLPNNNILQQFGIRKNQKRYKMDYYKR